MLSFRLMDMTAELSSLERAKQNCGGALGLSKALLKDRGIEITPQAISQWKQVPAGRVLDVEAVSGISRNELRPDLYGPAPVVAAPSIAPEPSQDETERASS